jgi:RNase P subunit RPR2
MLDRLAEALFAMTISEAHSRRVCVGCKKPIVPMLLDEAGMREYLISALCPNCFEAIGETR